MRVATVTMLEKNYNYGATLQAYALAKYVNELGYDCEVLRLCHYVDEIENQNTLIKKIIRKTKKVLFWKNDWKSSLWNIYGRICNEYNETKIEEAVKKNEIKFLEFVKHYIPCSKLYNKNNIAEANEDYDIFICGSDQIWKPECTNSSYFLEFCRKEKVKVAYAPSISRTELNRREYEYIKSKLCTFKATNVSVREQQGARIVSEILDIDVPLVLDPTFLVEKSDWIDLVKTKERIIKEPYCFSYLLSSNHDATHRIYCEAHKKGLKFANISYGVENTYYQYKKADYNLENIGPIEFLNLIYYADCIYTDSFHGTVFSIIFNKLFYVVKRRVFGTNKQMLSRFDTLLNMADAREHVIAVKTIGRHVECNKNNHYENLKKYIYDSKKFLDKCLE